MHPIQDTEMFPGSGVYHSSEIQIQFIFRNLKDEKMQSTTEQIGLSKVMQSTWANFAKNPTAGPGWDTVGTRIERIWGIST
jgi:carboxylesterase type B